MLRVRVENGGYTWCLKGTTWTGAPERADKFETRELAQAALDKAKSFTKPKLWKSAIIEEA